MRRVRWGVVLAALLAVGAVGGAVRAAPSARESVSPVVGVWSYGDTAPAVLAVGWEPRGLHGPKSAELYGDVLEDFRMWSGSCLHRKGERLFEVKANAKWPNSFEGTGVVLAGDVSTGDCSTRAGSKITISLNSYSGASPKYGMSICFVKDAGGAVCAANYWRAVTAGTLPTRWADYVAPGLYRGSSRTGVAFVVDAGGSFTEPSGRFVRDVVSRPTLACSLWSPEQRRWLPRGTSVGSVTTAGATLRIQGQSADATVAYRSPWTFARGVASRFEVQASFSDWTHLRGTIRMLQYSPVAGPRGLPANPDQPGTLRLLRCDSGAQPFVSEHVPGSWQAIAGNRK